METKINVLEDLEDFNQIELHYIFEDDTIHFLDAFTRNACEREFLKFIETISNEFGVAVQIKAAPKKEGSLIDWYLLFTVAKELNVPAYLNAIISLVAILFSLKTKDEKKGQKLDNMIKEADIIQKAYDLKSQGLPVPADIQEFINEACNSRKLDKQKSSFFKSLSNQKTVKKLQVSSKTITGNRFSFEINREDFQDYFLDSDNLESEIDSEAVVEVISPVLKKSKYSWRGIYRKENEFHEFTMLDKEFKKKVIGDKISFQNGSELLCEVEICKKLDDNGDEFNSKYKINKVYGVRIGNTTTEMPSGKRRKEKENMPQQMSLFDDTNDSAEKSKEEK